MSEIGTPTRTEFQTGEGAKRVTQTSTTSDETTQQQLPGKQAKQAEHIDEAEKQARLHDPAVSISASLTNLEAGGKIIANHIDYDGEGRPIITTEQGSYTLIYDAADEKDIQIRLRQYPVEIKIVSIDQEIKAEIIQTVPHRTSPERSTGETVAKEAIAVSLTLTSLGLTPPRINPQTAENQLAQENTRLQYRATDLYRAESIAKESAVKIEELPLPTSAGSYTLYHKKSAALPQTVPSSSATLSSSVMAQEIVVKATAPIPATPSGNSPSATAVNSPSPQTFPALQAGTTPNELNNFLQKTIFASVIKTFPKLDVPLPQKILKEIGLTTPLDNLRKGESFKIKIETLAIPAPATTSSEKSTAPAPVAIPVRGNTSPAPASSSTQASASPALKESSVKTAAVGTSPAAISGIIIDPSHSLLEKQSQGSSVQAQAMPAYRKRQNLGLHVPVKTAQTPKTHYMATPTSVIKFQSSIHLVPGTIIGFSVSTDIKAADITAQTRPSDTGTQASAPQTPAENAPGTTGAQANPAPAAGQIPPDVPLQPLEDIYEDWQSLNLMLSALSGAQNIPSGISQMMKSRMPTPQNPQQMTSTMIFFMAALGSANPAKTWLGPDVSQQLQRMGQEKLIRGLNMDMLRIRALSSDTPASEWRPLLIPFHTGQEINALPMLVRQIGDEGGKNTDPEADDSDPDQNITATRFIVEFGLSQLGQIILDGLLKDRQLDIIVRSEMRLPSKMKLQLEGLYTASLAKQDFSGELEFRDGVAPNMSVRKTVNQKIYMTAQQ